MGTYLASSPLFVYTRWVYRATPSLWIHLTFWSLLSISRALSGTRLHLFRCDQGSVPLVTRFLFCSTVTRILFHCDQGSVLLHCDQGFVHWCPGFSPVSLVSSSIISRCRTVRALCSTPCSSLALGGVSTRLLVSIRSFYWR